MRNITKILFLAFLGLNFICPQAVWAEYNENEAYTAQHQHNKIKATLKLFKAINNNDLEQVKKLIKAGADVNAKSDIEGTPLILAVEKRNTEIVKFLLSSGADVNKKITSVECIEGCGSPLLNAASEGQIELVKILIKAGADVNIESMDKETPIMLASINNYEDVVKILKAAGAKDDLYSAVMRGDIETVKSLIKNGEDVNKTHLVWNDALGDYEIYPSIIEAIKKEYWEIVRELIKAGANVNIVGTDGTPLTLVARKGNLDIIRDLLKNGASAGLNKALFEAVIMSNKDIVKELLNAGADVNYKNEYGKTPLSVAKYNKEISDLLKFYGAEE